MAENLDWDDFDGDDFLPFLKWQTTRTIFDLYGANSAVAYIKVLDKPIKFINKFGKEQYKVRVQQYTHNRLNDVDNYDKCSTESWLAGGIRLMIALKSVLKESNSSIEIIRTGKGFDTEYFAKAWINTTQKKLPTKNKKATKSEKTNK